MFGHITQAAQRILTRVIQNARGKNPFDPAIPRGAQLAMQLLQNFRLIHAHGKRPTKFGMGAPQRTAHQAKWTLAPGHNRHTSHITHAIINMQIMRSKTKPIAHHQRPSITIIDRGYGDRTRQGARSAGLDIHRTPSPALWARNTSAICIIWASVTS